MAETLSALVQRLQDKDNAKRIEHDARGRAEIERERRIDRILAECHTKWTPNFNRDRCRRAHHLRATSSAQELNRVVNAV